MKNIIFICLILFSFAVNAQEKRLVWDYPVKPGTEKWAAFTTSQQILEACQIPPEVLRSLNTSELVKTCMNYPLFFEYTAFNDEREGIKIMIEAFNGLKELCSREDGTKELIKVYKDFPIVDQIQSKTDQYNEVPYKLPFIELLLSNDVFVNKLDHKESLELRKFVLDKYERKVEHPSVYSLYNLKKTFLLGAVILDKQTVKLNSTKQQDVIKSYIKNFNNADAELLTEISKVISEL